MRSLTFKMLPGELWWGGSVAFATEQPYDENTAVTLSLLTQGANQSAPFFLSTKGRYVWSDTPITTVTFENGVQQEWKNTNATINPASDYYCPYAVGLKTGSTPRAGSCLLSAFECDGRTLVIGVFGCPADEDRFMDTLQLFNEAMGF